jgi:hypothetical protein
MHWPIEKFYKRRIRIGDSSPLIPVLEKAGYPIEKDTYADHTMVVTFPVYCGSETMQRESEVSIKSQMEMAALLQKHWADNQVSVTIKFWREPTIKEARCCAHLLLDCYISDVEGLKRLLRSRKVIDYSGSEDMQDMLDNRWEAVDSCEVILKILCDFAKDVDVMYEKKNENEANVHDMAHKSIMDIITVGSSSKERDLHEERVTDFLTVIKATYIAYMLYRYQNRLKAVSFLPMEKDVYKQAPYEHIEEEEYAEMMDTITPVHHWNMVMPQPEQPIGCDGDSCTVGSLGHSST